jgi:putative addiction module CopG family antidote
MSIDLSSDLVNEIQRQVATGVFATPDEVVREALAALRDREEQTSCARDDLAPPNTMSADNALREATEDLKAGFRSAADVSRDMRRKFNLPE